jgi:two-component system, NtrC family, C4-dicarboxylate transport sensor histidine kinase DctB
MPPLASTSASLQPDLAVPEPRAAPARGAQLSRVLLALENWARGLDPTRRKATITVRSFVSLAVLGVAGLSLAAFVPGPADFFRLSFWPALAWFVPPIAMGIPMGILEGRGRLSLRHFALLSLIGMFTFQVFMWKLVTLSSVGGATVMAAFPVLLVCFHGHLYQSGLKRPFPLLATLAALAVGLASAPGKEHLAVMLLAGPMAIGSHLVLGHYASVDLASRLEREALRAALDAQLLSARTSEAQGIADLLFDLRQRNHDAGNALSGSLLQMPRILELAERVGTDTSAHGEFSHLSQALTKNLELLQSLLLGSARLAREQAPPMFDVKPLAVTAEVLAEVGHGHPSLTLTLVPAPGLEHLGIPFFGGEQALRRVITNLVLNACQGDGTRGARTVVCRAALDDEVRFLSLEIVDDGPGFRPEQLQLPVDKLETTKTAGSGLGFYTASRLLAASGARVFRANRTDAAGAVVTVRLRLELNG